MAKTLKMVFRTAEGNDFTQNLKDPKADLADTSVKEYMNEAITNKIFAPKGQTLSGIKSASIVETTTTTLIAATKSA